MRGKIESTNKLVAGQRKHHGLKVVYLGGKQAGCIGLLTVLASGCRIQGVVAYDDTIKKLGTKLGLSVFSSIQPKVKELLSDSDLLVSVHCKDIITEQLLAIPRYGGINAHPCLYRYKGANPVGRLLKDECKLASVGVHRMTKNVDEGEVLSEEFVDINDSRSVEEVYNVLYPVYALALLNALQVIQIANSEPVNHI